MTIEQKIAPDFIGLIRKAFLSRRGIMTTSAAAAAGYTTGYIAENDYPDVEEDLVRHVEGWFRSKQSKEPDTRDIQRFVSEIYKHRR